MFNSQQCSSLLRKTLASSTLLRGGLTRRSSRLTPGLSDSIDGDGIPLRPTWSVNELLSSYPKPILEPSTLKRLHELSALIPPEEGTPGHAQLTSEMESLIKLVEAVKLVDVGQGSEEDGVPDGRIWAEGTGIELERDLGDESGVQGQALLRHAARTDNGLYVVDADRSKR